MSRVIVVGAGPGGIAAARHLRERGDGVEVTLIERGGTAEYLPGTIPVFLGKTPREEWRQRVFLDGVEVISGEAQELSGSGVRVAGEELEADAVIAAPGLALGEVPSFEGAYPFWSPEGAEHASGVLSRLEGGRVAVVISALPYRCPPAPYGLALALAVERPDLEVTLTTPEETPLAAIGGGVPEFLTESLADAGVGLRSSFSPDFEASGGGELCSGAGETVAYDAAFIVPPHVRSPLLRGLGGSGPLVEVSGRFETSQEGLFVVGDAAATPLPRAADAAAAEGRIAADTVLERLSGGEGGQHLPAPECYVYHGGGIFSRISMSFPDGLPPQGRAHVTLDKPSVELGEGFQAAFERWRAQRAG